MRFDGKTQGKRVSGGETVLQSSFAAFRVPDKVHPMVDTRRGSQFTAREHARFVVAVGGVDSYCDALQTVRFEHCKFEVTVGATIWYSRDEHSNNAAHCRFVVLVGATV